MSHPPRHDADDPCLARLRRICLSFPGADEKISHGHPVFFTKKIFAIYGGMVKGARSSDQFARSVLVLPDPEERPALLDEQRFFDPAYYGPSGWVGCDFSAGPVDWSEVEELVDASYRNTATTELIRRLDETR